jgi:Mrp family chromosome partitioning ATPase
MEPCRADRLTEKNSITDDRIMPKIDDAFIKIYTKHTSTKNEREQPKVVRANGADGTGAYRFDSSHGQVAAPRMQGGRSTASASSPAASTSAASGTAANNPAANNPAANNPAASASGSIGQPTPSASSQPLSPPPKFDAVHVEVIGFNPHDIPIAAPAVVECNNCGPFREPTLLREPASPVHAALQLLPQTSATESANRLHVSQQQSLSKPTSSPEPTSSLEPTIADFDESPPKSIQGFQAVWEVDGFTWPEPIERLEGRANKGLQEAGRSMRRACKDGLRIVGVTGTGRGQGRSTVALQLAKTASQHGMRVILIDADVDRPVLADRLGVEVTRGWLDALSDRLPLEEVAVYSVAEDLTLLPLVANGAGAVQLREATALIPEAFAMLARNHDLVIVDCGDIGALGNLFHDQKRQPLQSAMLVTDQRATRGDEFIAGIARLKRLGIRQLGIIENFVES